jgi:photosystem II stability/assembly factor-like uncharacterized protein
VNDVAFATPTTVFIVAGDDVYHSDDGGESWALSFSIYRGMRSLAVSPAFAADQTLFAVDGRSLVFRSTDGGETWEEVSRVAQVGGASDADVWLSISPAYPADPTLWATVEGGDAYRSTDSGLSWEPFDPGVPLDYGMRLVPNPDYPDDLTLEAIYPSINQSLLPPDLAYHPTTLVGLGSTLLLGTHYGLYRSADGGETWAEANTGLPRVAAGHLAVGGDGTIYGTYAGALYRLQVGGARWDFQGSLPEGNTGLGTVHTHDLAAVGGADEPTVLALTTYDGLFVSRDGGATWARMAGEGLPPITFHYPPPLLSADFAESGVAHLAYSGNIYRTEDGGGSWAKVEGVTGVEKLVETPDGRLIALGWSAVYEWDPESGAGWVRHPVHFGGEPSTVRFATDLLAVAIAGDNVYLSEDGGRAWTRIGQSELEQAYHYLISPRFDADHAIYAVGAAMLYVSTDAGRTWVEAGQGLPSCEQYGGPDCDVELLESVPFDGGYTVYGAVRHDFHSRIWIARAVMD